MSEEEKEFEEVFIKRLTGDDDDLQCAIDAGKKEKQANMGGEGSGNWNHEGRPGQVGGSGSGDGGGSGGENKLVDRWGGSGGTFVKLPVKVTSEQQAKEVFYEGIKKAQRSGGVYISHETNLKNIDSIRKNGLEDGSFGTLGAPSNFLSGERARVWIHLPPYSKYASIIVPDMRYDPDAPYLDMLTQHPTFKGADIGFTDAIPASWISHIEVITADGKIKLREDFQ